MWHKNTAVPSIVLESICSNLSPVHRDDNKFWIRNPLLNPSNKDVKTFNNHSKVKINKRREYFYLSKINLALKYLNI